MATKYPERSTVFPATVVKGRTVEHLRGLRESFLKMSKRRGKAPGTGGLRGEFLQVLGELLGDEHMGMLEDFGSDIFMENFKHGSTLFG